MLKYIKNIYFLFFKKLFFRSEYKNNSKHIKKLKTQIQLHFQKLNKYCLASNK